MRSRTDQDTVWSTVAQGFKCLHCGQPAIKVGGAWICINDPDCLDAMQDEEPETADCAGEGYGATLTPQRPNV